MNKPKTYILIHHCPVCQMNNRREICIGVDHHDLNYRCGHCNHYVDTWNDIMLSSSVMYEFGDIDKDVFYSNGQYWWIDESGTPNGPYFYESDAVRDYAKLLAFMDMPESIMGVPRGDY